MNILKAQRIGYNKAIKQLESHIKCIRVVSRLKEKILTDAIEMLKRHKP